MVLCVDTKKKKTKDGQKSVDEEEDRNDKELCSSMENTKLD